MNKEYRLFWQLTGTIYTLATVSVGLATTVYFAVSESTPGHVEFHEIFFAALYAVGTAAIGTLFWRARRSQRLPCGCGGGGGGGDRAPTAPTAGTGDNAEDCDDDEAAAVDDLPEMAFTGEGFNVYLRIGLAVFLAGCVVLNLLRCTAQLFHAPAGGNCGRAAAMAMNLLEIAFTASQAAFILRHHRAVFLRRKAHSRMALSHLFTANICIWASAAIGEIKEQLVSERRAVAPAAAGGRNDTVSEAVAAANATTEGASCEASWRLIEAVQPFLTPAVIEYCLLAAPMILHMLASVGDHRTLAERRTHRRSLLAAGGAHDASAMSTPPGASSVADCRQALGRRFVKSRRGLAFCLAAFAVTAGVTVVVYQLLSGVAATAVYLAQDLLLSGLGIALCVTVRRSLRRLALAKCDRHTFDDKLLIFALFGSMIYQVTMLVVMVDHAEVFPPAYLAVELLSLIVCAAQLLVQTFCLLDGLRRRASCLAEAQSKPGRGLVLALLGVNLSMWIMETFEVRKAEELLFSYRLGNVSESALKILIHIGQPINIFYRFHSTVCLSIMWRKAYELVA